MEIPLSSFSKIEEGPILKEDRMDALSIFLNYGKG